jgi:Holliday junction resolvase-like predicted endonuclease
MKEKDIEKYFCWAVQRMGGIAYKFKSPSQRGVTDRVVCLPGGVVWFVELKTKGGKLSALQIVHSINLKMLQQNYACLWTTEHVDEWVKNALPSP